jgi:hypothetical protein
MPLNFYVLIVMFHVNAGTQLTMHDFPDKASCLAAKSYIVKITEARGAMGLESIGCIPQKKEAK